MSDETMREYLCPAWSGLFARPPCRLLDIGDARELHMTTCARCPNAPADTDIATLPPSPAPYSPR